MAWRRSTCSPLTIALAIVDVHMPVMNGVELIRAMRADPRFALIPVVVQTSDRAAARAPSGRICTWRKRSSRTSS